jgi:hypothetical protein
MKNCGNCRFWSQMVAQSIGCGPIEALCLGEGKYKGRMISERMYCDSWKSDHFGKVDDPPNYGEISRELYEEEEEEEEEGSDA